MRYLVVSTRHWAELFIDSPGKYEIVLSDNATVWTEFFIVNQNKWDCVEW